jgi:hypothetical protein
MHAEHERLAGARAEFAPAREVQSNPLSRLHVDNTYPGWRLIEDPTTREINDLSNAVYRLLLVLLHQLVATAPAPLPRPMLAEAALRLMTAGVKPLCELLTALPMGDSSPYRARYAGASFELEHRLTGTLAPERALREELDALSAWTRRLAGTESASSALTPLAETLQEIGAHLRAS